MPDLLLSQKKKDSLLRLFNLFALEHFKNILNEANQRFNKDLF